MQVSSSPTAQTVLADGARASTSQRREDQRNTYDGSSDESCTSQQSTVGFLINTGK